MPSDTRRPFSGPEDGDMWISAGEAAALLGLKPDTLSKMRRMGRGPRWSTALGRRAPRYRASELRAFMEGGLVRNTAQADHFHRRKS